jgi:hypothetical protein
MRRRETGADPVPVVPHTVCGGSGENSSRPGQRIILGTVIPLSLALSLLLSYDWVRGGFYPNTSTNILLAVLGSSLVYLGLVLSRFFAFRRSCPGCGRVISFEAEVCPYCGRRLG